MNNTKSKSFLKAVSKQFKESLIIKFLFHLSELLYKKICSGIFAYILTGYEKLNNIYEKSFFYCLFQGYKTNKIKNFIRAIKKNISTLCENSLIINFFRTWVENLLFLNFRVYGVFLFSCGFYFTIIYSLKYFILEAKGLMTIDLFIGTALMVVGILLLPFKKPFYQYLLKSKTLNIIFFRFLDFEIKSLENKRVFESKRANIVLYAMGMVAGIASYIMPTYLIILTLVGLIAFYLLLCKPEIGMYLVFFGVPFLPTMALAGLCVITAVCFFLKLIRGKRFFRFEIFDLMMLVFCVVLFSGGIVSLASASLKPALLYLCFTVVYFIFVNMLKSKKNIFNSIGCLIVSMFITATYGIFQNYFDVADTTWQDTGMFSDISGRVVSTFENPNVLAEYLILIIPFTIIALMTLKKSEMKISSFICLASGIFCLVFTWSRGSWLGFLLSVFILFFIIEKRIVALYLSAFFMIPFLPLVLPDTIIQRFTSIGNISDSSTSYRLSIWQAAVKMLKDIFPGGIGIGIEPFKLIYPNYTLAGIESAPHSHSLYFQISIENGIFGLLVFMFIILLFIQCSFSAIKITTEKSIKFMTAAGLCAVFGYLLNGFTDFIWYNYRVFLIFWLVISVTIALCRYAFKNKPNIAQMNDQMVKN